MIHEDPLAYLLGLEGIALMRSFTGEHDRAFVEERIAEVRRLLADEALTDAAVDVTRLDTVEGYRAWAATYDTVPNGAFALDEPTVTELLDAVPAGVALDAACGTGRYSTLLARRGHRIVGVDSSPDMLTLARERIPDGDFRLGDLHRLPVADDEVTLVVCGLALTHVPELVPVFAEFARVLRPGGHLVIADMHPEAIARGAIPTVRTPSGHPARLTGYRHPVGDYLRAALSVGLRLRRCEEPPLPAQPEDAEPVPTTLGPWDVWPWSLAAVVPEASRAAFAGAPAMLIWHFQLADA